jgi:glycosyltransferase involved in cell wall biosynthesis
MAHWVIVLGWLDIGGAERQALKFAEGLLKRNYRVTIIGFSSPGRVFDECERLGIECLYWPMDLEGSWLRKLKTIVKFWWRILMLRPTYIAPYTMLPNVLCGLVWRFTSAKACIWQQRDEGRLRQQRIFERLAVRWTPGFISNSEHGKEWLVNALGVKPSRINIVRNGVASHAAPIPNTVREKLGLPEDVPLVTMVANLHRYKDHMTLLKAWKELKAIAPELKSHLVLAGRHDDAYEDINLFIRQEVLCESVQTPGSVENVSALLAETAVFVFSSRNEGCSNAVLEAMAAGLPVIATDISANREALGIDNNAYLIKPNDSEAMAIALRALLRDQELGREIGKKNRHRIHACFTESAMVESTESAFRDHGVGYLTRFLGLL